MNNGIDEFMDVLEKGEAKTAKQLFDTFSDEKKDLIRKNGVDVEFFFVLLFDEHFFESCMFIICENIKIIDDEKVRAKMLYENGSYDITDKDLNPYHYMFFIVLMEYGRVIEMSAFLNKMRNQGKEINKLIIKSFELLNVFRNSEHVLNMCIFLYHIAPLYDTNVLDYDEYLDKYENEFRNHTCLRELLAKDEIMKENRNRCHWKKIYELYEKESIKDNIWFDFELYINRMRSKYGDEPSYY